MASYIYLFFMAIAVIGEIIIYEYIKKRSQQGNNLIKHFKNLVLCMIFWACILIVQLIFIKLFGESIALYVDYFTYIPVVLLPVILFYFVNSFEKSTYKPSIKGKLLFIVPILTLLIIWTNDLHHLFYKKYSLYVTEVEFGPYFTIHSLYTYGLIVVSVVKLLKASIKKSKKVFTPQFLLFAFAVAIPLLLNVLGMTNIVPMTVYVTPISFSITILLIGIAILKYNFLDVAPIALQRIVNQMSDAYLVLTKDYVISDCNRSFEKIFKVKKEYIIGKNYNNLDISDRLEINEDKKVQSKYLEQAQVSENIIKVNAKLKDEARYFNVEISGIISNNQCVGILMLFKDTTQHILDMEELKNNQNQLMEKERLATLGQMIGGVAHNLKTPIMSIAGAMEGLDDLITEYEASIEDPEVGKEDHHAIAHDMREWVEKVSSYDTYMSDIITAVKGQAVNFNDSTTEVFKLEEFLSRVNILMKHELKNALITLNVDCRIDKETSMIGNINALVQVVNNLIQNAIQAYAGKENQSIDLTIDRENEKIVISVADNAGGIPKEVRNELFSKMVTTKGHNGSGLGLFMSYSTIKGNFKGDMTFDVREGEGTTFKIILPNDLEKVKLGAAKDESTESEVNE